MASADLYDCTTTNFGSGGWIPEKYFLEFDPNTGAAKALDGGIYQVHKKAVPVEFGKRSATSYTFRWTNSGLKSTNSGSAKLSYKVTLFADRNRFNVTGRIHGGDNVISGSGTCVQKN